MCILSYLRDASWRNCLHLICFFLISLVEHAVVLIDESSWDRVRAVPIDCDGTELSAVAPESASVEASFDFTFFEVGSSS